MKTKLLPIFIVLAVVASGTLDARAQYTLTTLGNFSLTAGDTPTSLVADASGNLYGTTEEGGAQAGARCSKSTPVRTSSQTSSNSTMAWMVVVPRR